MIFFWNITLRHLTIVLNFRHFCYIILYMTYLMKSLCNSDSMKPHFVQYTFDESLKHLIKV